MASTVWKAALLENTALARVSNPDDMEPYERVMYRLIDGVYTSITSHIAEYTKADDVNGVCWYVSSSCYR